MKHSSTWDLLDLADDLINLRDMSWTHSRRESAMIKLAEIDTELLSRMPEYELMTVYDWVHYPAELNIPLEPIGFEPTYYANLLIAQRELEWIDSMNLSQMDDSSYYFYRD